MLSIFNICDQARDWHPQTRERLGTRTGTSPGPDDWSQSRSQSFLVPMFGPGPDPVFFGTGTGPHTIHCNIHIVMKSCQLGILNLNPKKITISYTMM